MPGPHSPEALRSLAITRLDYAYSFYHGSHGVGIRASRPEPTLDPALLAQRQQIYRLAQLMIEKEFEAEMDALVACWLEYQKVREK